MKKSKLKLEKTKIVKLKNLQAIRGGKKDGETIIPQCKENSRVWDVV